MVDVTPVGRTVASAEGIHIGYRAWLKAGATPAYEFGSGFGYTSWSLDDLSLDTDSLSEGGSVIASVRFTNTGERRGKQVVQVYAARATSAIDRPVRWLVGFAPVAVDPGESGTVTVTVPARAFADWQDGWHYEAGEFTLHAGTSVSALPLSQPVVVR